MSLRDPRLPLRGPRAASLALDNLSKVASGLAPCLPQKSLDHTSAYFRNRTLSPPLARPGPPGDPPGPPRKTAEDATLLWTLLARAPRVREDRAGKAAGVLYYALVGWVVAESSARGILGREAVARGADAVFAYTLAAFWLGRVPSTSSSRGRSTRST